MLHRSSVAQYEAMRRAGILSPNDRVELLEGLLVEKPTKTPRHRVATHETRVALERVVQEGFYVDSQEPIVTRDSSPEPDVCVIRGTTKDYLDSNPPASAVAIVVEVADDSLEDDRRVKARIYARAGIPTYWIVNVRDRQLEVHGSPSVDVPVAAYGDRKILGEDELVEVVIEARVCRSIPVRSLLP